MPEVTMTSHLHRFFPKFAQQKIWVSEGSVAEVLKQLDNMAPGFGHYVLDDSGALRRHVNISIDNELLVDRKNLADHVAKEAKLYIFQSLTGG